jgi:dihydrofolate synthase/folylpolyglutamate synthase
MTYQSAIRFLFDLQRFGIKAGLRNIGELLRETNHPERRFPAIHIAGTNGKGSTSSIIAAILTASGFRTGLYTSPHLVRFSERIRIDGREMPMREIAGYTEELAPAIRRCQATFFEATTAFAFN